MEVTGVISFCGHHRTQKRSAERPGDQLGLERGLRSGGAGDHTPHDARYAMGRHLIEKTGNIAAVQRQD